MSGAPLARAAARAAVALGLTWGLLLAPPLAAEPVAVTFRLNDAQVKDKALAGVAVGVARTRTGPFEAKGTTDAQGVYEARLEPGGYFVSYRLRGYVSVERSPLEVGPQPQTVTTTLSMMMEDAGLGGRSRLQVVLNWGSDRDRHVKDADSHLVCACRQPGSHVFFSSRKHEGEGHAADLDVDDVDWGGPETVTVVDPPPGQYVYWVHDYSGGRATLAASDVRVRVLWGDTVLGELRVPPSASDRNWRPFRAVEVDAMGDARLVPFTEAELQAGVFRQPPPDVPAAEEVRLLVPGGSSGPPSPRRVLQEGGALAVRILAALLALLVLVRLARRKRRPRTR